jgi:hypothetical protein
MKKVFSLIGLMYFTLICCLVACLAHTSFAFGSVNGGNMVEAYISAIAIDLGLLVLSASIMKWKRENRKTWPLWIGVFLFSAVSAYANWLSGVVHVTPLNVNTNDVGQFMIGIRPFALSGILPILVIYMSEVLANYYQVSAKREDARVKRAVNKAARNASGKSKKATASKDWSPKIPQRELV